ncbi:MAG: amino acid deaminase [Gemmatimonadota bacterium]
MTALSSNEPLLDARLKGIPGGTTPFAIDAIGEQRWNLLREDLPLPAAILRESALDHNSAWMQRFVAMSGAVLCPHGKTTMSPDLFKRQLGDGAWGITLSNASQLQVARTFGIRRVLLANQLVGRQAIRYVLDELAKDPEFDFYCLVDSVDGVDMLARAARERSIGRPLQVLLEGGFAGGRTGCRNLADGLAVGRAVKAAAPYLALRGIEGFEGILGFRDPSTSEPAVHSLLEFLSLLAAGCAREDLFGEGPVILTAGGSTFYDMVMEQFRSALLPREAHVVVRSGCYLTHDSHSFKDSFARLLERSAGARSLGEGLRPALEVWSYVQSQPEANRAFLTMGKRDCSYDMGLPMPFKWFRPGLHKEPVELHGHTISMLNDQHAYLDLPAGSPLKVGDMVASGISHPCTTFDKWRLLLVVNDEYDVVSAVRTFF